MDNLLKTAGLVLYVVVYPLFAVTEIVIDIMVFFKLMVSFLARIRFVRTKRGKLLQSLDGQRFHFPFSLEKQQSL